jgi:3-(3-hydroxy-phenyl)propionate hydroxylase
LKAILHGGADATRLDLYDRRRRIVARDEILAQTDRNRTRMQERDPDSRRAHLSKLQAIARDPVQCKAYLMQTSMIDGLRRAASIE